MRKIWFDEAWEDYLYWQTQDKKTLKRINALLKDVERNKFTVQILLERYAYSEIVGTFILI